ncbi:MAG: response regulator [Sulfuricurvum sp.]|uniref:response regulator n=1 Tax=Sulfuricurvum sp. TaxID=2025608 RepID=UPI00261947DE|nr:response regulator [Sulfuricurvum sp.]MDD5159009.1 response regulator [Sulfuricurvum sp.]
MFNEFQQEIIITVAVVVAILVVYFIFKRSSTPQIPSEKPEKHDIPEVAAQEKVTVAPEIKEEPQAKPLPEIPLPVKEERDFEGITPAHEDTFKDVTSRRKSDKTIPKRSVPEHGKITKQNFSEFAGERILVAEDNIINQKVLLGLLAGSGIELIMANDGQEALDILENDTNFLMILMDAHMPRVDGFEATRIIRENPKYDHILVVALSGDTASDDIQKMKSAGMAEQLEKPLRMESLYKVIYAYSGKETQKDESIEVNLRKNLDVEKGLQTCGEDENFYREILAEFMLDYANSSDKLGELLRSNNLQDADAYLLDIIGVTENIGAHPLGEIASNMKLALSDPHEQSYFILFDQYKIQLERLKQDIREYL